MAQHFGYIRVSTARQGERGVSLQEQRDAIERYARANSLQVTQWHEERVTAAKAGRPVFARMLSLLRKGVADGVIMHKIDRSARNLRDWANLAELFDQGIDVRFAHESLDLSSRGGRLSADIQAVVAADYIRNLRDETLKGFYGRLKQGLYPLAAPLGYRDEGKGVPKSICPVNGPLVRQAFEAYATGKYSLHALMELVHAAGLRSRAGGKVQVSGISRMLHNPFYTGIIRLQNTGETFAGVHEPLIPKSLFDRVQHILAGKKPKDTRRHEFLYSQLFTCQACGHFLIAERQKGRAYYRCHTRNCRQTCLNERYLDTAVRAALAPLQLSPQEVGLLEREIDSMRGRDALSQAATKQALQLQGAALEKRLNRLTDVYLEQGLGKEEYERRKRGLLEEQAALREKMDSAGSATEDIVVRIRKAVELGKSIMESHETGNPAQKRELVKTVFSNRSALGKNVVVERHLLYELMAKRPGVPKGDPHRCTSRTFLEKIINKFK